MKSSRTEMFISEITTKEGHKGRAKEFGHRVKKNMRESGTKA